MDVSTVLPGARLENQVAASRSALQSMTIVESRLRCMSPPGQLQVVEHPCSSASARFGGTASILRTAACVMRTHFRTYPTLPIASDPVKPGDRVLALGHSQETVWS